MTLQYSYDPDGKLVYVADQSGTSTKFVIDGLPMREALQALWNLACVFDEIPTETKFACFSDNNPYEKMHQKAMLQMFKSRKLG